MNIDEAIKKHIESLNTLTDKYHYYRNSSRVCRKEIIGGHEFVQWIIDITKYTDDDLDIISEIVKKEEERVSIE